ncbi:MAG TPA: peptidoglycan-associated lipoprotein Pal [Gemmatimonadaceae bacterium]|nr:peptidoglycan-associated lipoprotein Pal [Gemmatimonadaceae bacterium]
MLRRRWTVCAMTALLFGGTAAAQAPGTLLIGGFGQYTKFADELKLGTAPDGTWHWGAGGRIGAYFAPNWNLEAENSWNRPEQWGAGQTGKIWYGPVSARIRYSFPLANIAAFHVGAGGVVTGYAGFEPDQPSAAELIPIKQNRRGYNYGVTGDVGFTFGLGLVGLRVDGIADYMPNGGPTIGAGGPAYDAHTNFRLQAGLELHPDLRSLFGGGEPGVLAPWAPYMFWDEMPEHALPGTLEIGPFVQWTHFDDDAPGRPDDHIGFGGRVGVFLSDTHWELEGDGQNTKTTRKDKTGPFFRTGVDDVSYTTFALRMLYNIPIASAAEFILGAGAVRTNYASESTINSIGREFQYNYGVSGDVGLRFRVANRVALRIDGVADYMKDTKNLNLIGRAGLSLLIGGARREVMCTYAGLENIPASSPQCVPPAPPPPPPPPPAPMCPYPGLGNLTASDPACVAPVPVMGFDTTAFTAPIYFDYDKSTIRPDAAATLDTKIKWLAANSGVRIRIEGNADERGSDEYNLALGQRRAASAKKYMVERGIAADRFDLVSYGEERPVCTDHNEECWQKNRRDDFVIVTMGSGPIVVPPGQEE